jgi:hypothetical protein
MLETPNFSAISQILTGTRGWGGRIDFLEDDLGIKRCHFTLTHKVGKA